MSHAHLGRVTTGESGFKVGFGGRIETVPVRREGEGSWIAGIATTVHTTPSTDNTLDHVPSEPGFNLSFTSGKAIPIEAFGTLIVNCES